MLLKDRSQQLDYETLGSTGLGFHVKCVQGMLFILTNTLVPPPKV
jgi:hypothetical protein